MTVDAAEPQAVHRRTGFFRATCAAFDEAAYRAGVVERFFRPAGQTICFRFAGDALVPLLAPALQPCEVPPSPAALTIRVWDSGSAGVPMPPPAWSSAGMRSRGEIAGWEHGPRRLAYQSPPDPVSMMDEENAGGLFWIEDAALT